jgi:two-component system NarL family sensor kinase
MLNVASRDWRVLTADELNVLTTAGALVSLAIERTRLEAEGARMRATEVRNQLAREIHDTLAQSLAALTLQLEVADAQATRAGDPVLSESMSRALHLTRATLEEARRSVLDLREGPLDGTNLHDAIVELGAGVRAAAADRFAVTVTCEGFDAFADDLPADLVVGLYRIAQQALANAAAHAQPTHISVLLTRGDDEVLLRIEDDGVGFDTRAVGGDHFGIVGMNERARLLGGSLCIDSSPGDGTVLEVRAPVRGRVREEALR